jgi:hypothetical protein
MRFSNSKHYCIPLTTCLEVGSWRNSLNLRIGGMEEDGSSGESDTDSTENPVLPFSPCEDLTALWAWIAFSSSLYIWLTVVRGKESESWVERRSWWRGEIHLQLLTAHLHFFYRPVFAIDQTRHEKLIKKSSLIKVQLTEIIINWKQKVTI